MINRHSVKRHFSRSATSYNASAIMQKEVAERLAERLPLFKITPEQIIDLGAGTGFLSQHIRSYYSNSQLTLVDLSFSMLQQSQQLIHKTEGWRNWFSFGQSQEKSFFVNADAYHLPFADRSVDMLVSSLMLQWCDDLETVLAECYRVLKPDGLFYIATLGPDTLKEIRQAWQTVDNKDHAHVSPFIDMHDIGSALNQAGFINAVLDTEYITLTYSNAADAVKDLKNIGATNAQQNNSAGLTGKSRWSKFLAAYNAQANQNGRISATFEVIYAHAWTTSKNNKTSHTTEIPISTIKRWKH